MIGRLKVCRDDLIDGVEFWANELPSASLLGEWIEQMANGWPWSMWRVWLVLSILSMGGGV